MKPPPNLRNALWQGYAAGTENVEYAFWDRYRRKPAYVWERVIILAGPITQQEHDEKKNGRKP